MPPAIALDHTAYEQRAQREAHDENALAEVCEAVLEGRLAVACRLDEVAELSELGASSRSDDQRASFALTMLVPSDIVRRSPSGASSATTARVLPTGTDSPVSEDSSAARLMV